MKDIILNVEGMVCDGCEKRVINALSSIEGVQEVIANYQKGTVILKTNKMVDISDIKEKIEDLGFEVRED